MVPPAREWLQSAYLCSFLSGLKVSNFCRSYQKIPVLLHAELVDFLSLVRIELQQEGFQTLYHGSKSFPDRVFTTNILKAQSSQKCDHSCAVMQNLEILSLVRRELQREGFIKVFKVHIHPTCQSGDMPRLQRIITQLGSEIMTSESERSPLKWPFA